MDSEIGTITIEPVRAAAQQLRDALETGDVHTIEVYFVHNTRHSANVDQELTTVESSLRGKLERWSATTGSPITGVARQLSLPRVINLYESRYSSIRVSDTVEVQTVGPIQTIVGPNWRSMYATVLGQDLASLVQKYADDLYSANIRDYLGKRASTRNINRQIAHTALQEPQNFWVFNNGVTLISRQVESKQGSLVCSGLAVINGAQTLGALHDAVQRGAIDQVQLLVRVVESRDDDLVQDIIRYNNTQNPIKAWELRVLDPVQQRIRQDFEFKLSITYQFRRGLGRRGAQDVLFEKLGPWLHSFYGDPLTSHRNSPQLWDYERTYRYLFSDTTDVRHLLFVYRLGEAVGGVKDEYRAATEQGTANETDATLYSYFRYGAFNHVAIHVCAETLAEVFGGGPQVKKRFILSEASVGSRETAMETLKRIVKFSLAPIPAQVSGGDAYEHFRSSEGISNLASHVRTTVNQMRGVSPEIVDKLKDGIQLL